MNTPEPGSLREQILEGVPLFENLAPDEIALLADHCSDRRAGAGEKIFREGDVPDGLYVVETGAVSIVRDAVGQPAQLLARLGPGGFFGEMGLLDTGARTATAVASEATALLHVRKQALVDLLQQRPLLAVKLRAAIIRRHGHNVASAVQLSGRKEVRTRIDADVEAELPDGTVLELMLENLSPGGACLRGFPADWRPGKRVVFAIRLPGSEALLDVDGNVSWRSDRAAGVAFRESKTADGAVRGAEAVRRAIRVLLER